MRMTERRLRSLIRSIIIESNENDMSFMYNGIDVDIIDSGDIFMYGDTSLFNEAIKNKFIKIKVEKIASEIDKLMKDSNLDKRELNIKKHQVYKPIKDVMESQEFQNMIDDIRICKFEKKDEQDFAFYDMELKDLLYKDKGIKCYYYFGEVSEKDGDDPDAALRGYRLLKIIKPQNFAVVSQELIQLFSKIGKLSKIKVVKEKNAFKNARNNIEMKNLLSRYEGMKKFIDDEEQYMFNPETQSFDQSGE